MGVFDMANDSDEFESTKKPMAVLVECRQHKETKVGNSKEKKDGESQASATRGAGEAVSGDTRPSLSSNR
jgi:hypothetical protein